MSLTNAHSIGYGLWLRLFGTRAVEVSGFLFCSSPFFLLLFRPNCSDSPPLWAGSLKIPSRRRILCAYPQCTYMTFCFFAQTAMPDRGKKHARTHSKHVDNRQHGPLGSRLGTKRLALCNHTASRHPATEANSKPHEPLSSRLRSVVVRGSPCKEVDKPLAGKQIETGLSFVDCSTTPPRPIHHTPLPAYAHTCLHPKIKAHRSWAEKRSRGAKANERLLAAEKKVSPWFPDMAHVFVRLRAPRYRLDTTDEIGPSVSVPLSHVLGALSSQVTVTLPQGNAKNVPQDLSEGQGPGLVLGLALLVLASSPPAQRGLYLAGCIPPCG